MSSPTTLLEPLRNTGSAYASLPEKQQRFVTAMIIVGAKKEFGAEAARLAGYAPNSAKQEAYRLLRNDRVLAAIREEANKRLQANVLLGAMVLEEIALDPLHKDRMKAATELMNRGGMQLAERHEHDHIVRHERSTAELLAVIAHLSPKAKDHFIDAPYKELPKPVEDAEMTDDDLAEIMGSD